MKILEKVVVFMLDIHTYTGRKQLTVAERRTLGIEGDEVLSVGHKKIVDPKEVAVFSTLKKRAERILGNHGVKFLGGYAIPVDKAQDIAGKLDEIAADYVAAKDSFLSSFEDKIQSWAQAHPEHRSMITGSRHESEYLSRALRCKYYSVAVMPADGISSEMSNAEHELGSRLFTEIGKDAKDLFERTLKGRSTITRKTLAPFYRLLEKVRGMMFVHPSACKLTDYMESILDSLPKDGPIGPSETATLAGMVLVLAQGDGQVPEVDSENHDDELFSSVTELPLPASTALPQNQLSENSEADESNTSDEEDDSDSLDMAEGWF